jgi:hypothetical protein
MGHRRRFTSIRTSITIRTRITATAIVTGAELASVS